MNKLLKFELIKFLKDKRFIILSVIICIFSFISGYILYLFSPFKNKPSGFLMISNSLNFTPYFLSMFTLISGALIFSIEFENRTLHMVLLGKYSRFKIIISKIISLSMIALFLLLISFLFMIFSGLSFSKFEGIVIQGYILKKSSSLWLYTILTFLLILISLYTYSLMGIFLGIITKSVLLSVLFSIVLYFFLNILSIFPGIQNFIFPYYLNLTIELFSKITKGIDVSYFPFLYYFFLTNFFYIFCFILMSIFLFKRMEL